MYIFSVQLFLLLYSWEFYPCLLEATGILVFNAHTAIHMHSSVNIVCLCCKCECFNVFVLSFLQATMGLFYYYWLMERF